MSDVVHSDFPELSFEMTAFQVVIETSSHITFFTTCSLRVILKGVYKLRPEDTSFIYIILTGMITTTAPISI